MDLQYQVETLDGLDDAIKPLYSEHDGAFRLNVSGAVPQAQFDALNQKSVDNATEAQRRRRRVEGVMAKLGLDDAAGIDDALDGLIAGKGGKSSADQEAIVKQIKDQAAADIKAANDRLTGVIIDGGVSQLQAALMGAGFGDAVAKMIAESNKNRLSVDETQKLRIMGANGNPLAGSGSDGHANYSDLANEFAAAMPEFIINKGKGGGGKPPAGGGGNAAQGISRDQFNEMGSVERSRFLSGGGKVNE